MKRLSTQYANCFPQALRNKNGLRLIGREAEFPVVNYCNSEAGDVQRLMKSLQAQNSDLTITFDGVNGDASRVSSAKNEQIEYTIEVGTGTVEMIHGPHENLHALKQVHEEGLERLKAAATSEELLVLGCGIQPVTPASAELTTQRKRYGLLTDVFGASWELFSATASDQTHVDITRDEIALVTSVGNAATPSLLALCGNSAVSGTGPVCVREVGTWETMGSRHGMPPGPVRDVEEWCGQLCAYDFVLAPPTDSSQEPALAHHNLEFKPFLESWCAPVNGSTWEDFLFHEHYVWHAARPRSRQGTVEVRPCCQQPFEDHMVVSALSLGLVEAAPELAEFIAAFDEAGGYGEAGGNCNPEAAADAALELVSSSSSSSRSQLLSSWHSSSSSSSPGGGGCHALQRSWARLCGLNNHAAVHGLADSPTNNGSNNDVGGGVGNSGASLRALTRGVLVLAAQGLAGRGLGEEEYLAPLWKRLEAKENPGQVARRQLLLGFESSGGFKGGSTAFARSLSMPHA